MITSKQIVKDAIYFNTPQRLPINFKTYGASDLHNVGWNQIGTGDNNTRKSYDEWGCGWERSEVKNMGLITEHPLSDWSNLDSYVFLDPEDPALYEGMEERFSGSDDKYILTGIFMILFERLHGLRGFENTLLDLYIEKDKISLLADKVVHIQTRIIKNISQRFPGKIDGISFSDDWGTERALFINPELWREFFKPRYQKIFDACHEAGWDVWVHSCGKIDDILDDWIETGVNVFNLQQPNVFGIEKFGKRFAGKVCFESLCDIQMTLPSKNDREIESEAVRLMMNWGTPQGGFIFSDYGDSRAIGVTEDRKKVMFNAFLKNDRWKK
jgi:uroporphyrinogen decarboxylase